MTPISQKAPSPPTLPETSPEENSSKKIYNFIRAVGLRNKSLQEQFNYILENPSDPKGEKLLVRLLEKNFSFIEHSAQISPPSPLTTKINKLFTASREEHRDKEFRVTEGRMGLYGRNIPEVNILPKESPLGTPLHFIPEASSHKPVSGPPVQNQAEANYLVQCLADIKEIPWNYARSKCQYRATAACQILEHMGIPQDTIQKIWIKADRNSFLIWNNKDHIPAETRHWRWHIAPLIRTEGGEKYVLDPSLNSQEALSVKKWKETMLAAPSAQCQEAPLSCWDPEKTFEEGEVPHILATQPANTFMYYHRLMNVVPFESKTKENLAYASPNTIKADENKLPAFSPFQNKGGPKKSSPLAKKK